MITAALEGKLASVRYRPHSVFGMMVPEECQGVPSEILNTESTWKDKDAYTKTASRLARHFIRNFEKYKDSVSDEILAAAPKI